MAISERRNVPAGTRANQWELTNESSTIYEIVDRERAYRAAGSAHARRDSRWAPEFNPYPRPVLCNKPETVLRTVLHLDSVGMIGMFHPDVLREAWVRYPEHREAIERAGRGNVA